NNSRSENRRSTIRSILPATGSNREPLRRWRYQDANQVPHQDSQYFSETDDEASDT
ncbi:15423_t:CDS:1, partial [Acaulospora colombiana]